MTPTAAPAPNSKAALWTSHILQGLLVLFLLFDALTKLLKVAPVLQAAARLGFSVHEIVVVGITLLVCTIIYVIPNTSVLGAVLLTGYFGGAVETQIHIGSPVFETLFPVLFGILVWLPLFIRDRRVRALIPLRANEA
jgi:hypothetical protein